jgi:hypothetical protein
MLPGKQLIVLLLAIFFLYGCKPAPDPSLHFYIGNFSRIQKKVDIQVAVGGEPLFDSAVKFLANPYQYRAEKKLPRGNYTINVKGDSGKITMIQPLTIKDELWIFISYTFGSPADTIFRESALKNIPPLAAIDLAKPKPSLHIFISDSKPGQVKADSIFRTWAEDTLLK